MKRTEQAQSQQEAKASPVYLQVRRDWLEDQQVPTGGQINPGETGSAPGVMQRWHQESIRDQPYNHVGAVTAQDVGRN